MLTKFLQNLKNNGVAGAPTTQKEQVLIVLAMRRSGHHAVINQLCYQLGHVVHLNNCIVRGFLRRAYPRSGRFRHYRDGKVYDSGVQSFWQYRRTIAQCSSVPNLVYSFEDVVPSVDYRPFVDPHKSLVTLCVVRDPFNWLASSLQRGQQMTRALKHRIDLWKQQVEQCLTPDRYPFGVFVGVNYNAWVNSQTYRGKLSERLGLAYSEVGRDEVIDFGVGSSFDGKRFDGQASAMPVLERWKAFADDSRYRALVQDTQLVEFSERYFDFNPFATRHGAGSSEPNLL